LKIFQKIFPIPTALKDSLLFITARCDVVKGAEKGYAQRMSHFRPPFDRLLGHLRGNTPSPFHFVKCGALTPLYFSGGILHKKQGPIAKSLL
jgi:hypothetical protein